MRATLRCSLLCAIFLPLLIGPTPVAALAYKYPAYCAKDIGSDPTKRQSPPLSAKNAARDLELAQVQVVLRHGARTPGTYAPCWKGYEATWDCRYFGILRGASLIPRRLRDRKVTQSKSRGDPRKQSLSLKQTAGVEDAEVDRREAREVEEEESVAGIVDGGNDKQRGVAWVSRGHDWTDPAPSPTFPFRLVYDGDPTHNQLNGTCEKGQLLVEGALQHEVIGRLLAESYLTGHHPRRIPKPHAAPLLDLGASDFDEQLVYARTTDMQRTRMSAANLLSSMLNIRGKGDRKHERGSRRLSVKSMRELHTMDMDLEFLVANSARCPMMDKVRASVVQTPAYKEMEKKHEKLLLKLNAVFGLDVKASGMWPSIIMDCLMTSICTHRWTDIPDALRPNGPDPAASKALLEEVASTIEQAIAFVPMHSNATWARLGMHKLVTEMKDRIGQVVVRRHYEEGQRSAVSRKRQADDDDVPGIVEPPLAPKLVVWSGHDTTVAPLLAALGVSDGRWPPYASVVILELFEAKSKREPAATLNRQTESEQKPTSTLPLDRYSVRLVYNGQILTDKLDGCPSGEELCPVELFTMATAWTSTARDICATSMKEEGSSFHHLVPKSISGNPYLQHHAGFEKPPERDMMAENAGRDSISRPAEVSHDEMHESIARLQRQRKESDGHGLMALPTSSSSWSGRSSEGGMANSGDPKEGSKRLDYAQQLAGVSFGWGSAVLLLTVGCMGGAVVGMRYGGKREGPHLRAAAEPQREAWMPCPGDSAMMEATQPFLRDVSERSLH